MKYFIFYILTGFMLLLTSISFFPRFYRFFFIGGTNESLAELITANIIVKVGLLFISVYLLYKVFGRFNGINVSIFLSVFFFWVMSGRTVGILPDGKIKTGWFYFKTRELDLCKESIIDCQTITDYQTKIEKRFFWNVEIKNLQIKRFIFIGPVIWYSAIKALKKSYGSGTYTRLTNSNFF